MNIFTDAQRGQVCAALAFRAGYTDGFTAEGPSATVMALAADGYATASANARLLLCLALALWTGRPGPAVTDLVVHLGEEDLSVVAELLRCLHFGTVAEELDHWITVEATHRRLTEEGRDRRRPPSGPGRVAS